MIFFHFFLTASVVPPPPPLISGLERVEKKLTVSSNETIPKTHPLTGANEMLDFEQELKSRLRKRAMSVDSTSEAMVTTLESIRQPTTVPSTPTSQRLQHTAGNLPHIIGQRQQCDQGQVQNQGQSIELVESRVVTNLCHSFASNRQKFDAPKPAIADQTFKPDKVDPAFLTKHKMVLTPQSEKFRDQIIPSQSSYPGAENVDDWYEQIPAEEVFHQHEKYNVW
ncbi:hypothetical protein CHS0354_009285 [Potamilus streckersoni]|uniref:Uncharacterized protein n=1 Tax=Potamilus streckersoni TaxID=2493646 RepID=A0AAE0T7M0_9BIVA|nr:hypothetical protein CHS0354_009285 [Potamilus streckersoni]